MEMSSVQWWSEPEMEAPDLVGLSEPTAEQLEALMNYNSNFAYDSLTSTLTGYPRNLKLPASVSHLGARSSGGNLGYERPAKQSKANNSEDSSLDFQPKISSKVSTPPCISVPNSQQKLQHQQIENYFSSLFKLKTHQTHENLGLTAPCKQAEILVSRRRDRSCCISDITHSHIDAFHVSPAQLFSKNDGPSDVPATSSAHGGNRHSNKVANKASANSQEHIMAERIRREKLGQRFIALSAILPGLKKMDKISVLGDAIKYVKQLQDRIQTLEEQTPKKTVQSVVYVKKKELCTNDQDSDKVSSSSINSSSDKDVTEGVLTPEIEIRVINRNVLIHVHCEKRKGLLMKFVAELERLQLTVVNASILSFSDATFDLTFNCQMEEGCDLTVTDMVKALQALLKKMV